MIKELRSAALDILFSMVVYILFMDKITGWILNNERIRNMFPPLQSVAAPLCVTLPIQAAAFSLIAEYTGSAWSAVLFDFPFVILMDCLVIAYLYVKIRKREAKAVQGT